MHGLMQDWPLTVDKILNHANMWHPDREIVTRSVEGSLIRSSYAHIWDRAKRLSNALKAMGIIVGDRVASLAWNTARHMETWYAVMGIGAICHTINPRLHAEQILYIVNHAADKILFTDVTFLPMVLEIRARMPTVKHIVVMTDRDTMREASFPCAVCFEDLVADNCPDCEWGGFDENTAAGLCYTSGTTGNPKGVLYSHRSNFLHTLVINGADVMAVSARDTVLPMVPMFHANAWGLAFACPAVGAKMVLPGQKLDGLSVYELLEGEEVTFAAAVPTVWQMLLAHLRATKGELSTLRRVVFGGAAPPASLVRAFRDEYGVEAFHGWGMTEMSPLGTFTSPTAIVAQLTPEEQLHFTVKQGRPPLGVEIKLTSDDGHRIPHDGRTQGALKVRGPCVAASYFGGSGALDREGFFETGDVATLDDQGYLHITDRAKDVIKSGGEWISSTSIENMAMEHPKALRCAVIGARHPKWDERPILLVQLKDGETASKDEFFDLLEGKITQWWMPDDLIFVAEIPLGTTGKIDKRAIREQMKNYMLPTIDASRADKP